MRTCSDALVRKILRAATPPDIDVAAAALAELADQGSTGAIKLADFFGALAIICNWKLTDKLECELRQSRVRISVSVDRRIVHSRLR